MVEKANPSNNRSASSFKTAGAISYGGYGSDGWIVPSSNPTEISIQDADIVEGDLNAFTETSSASSFDVTFDGGEAFVFGSWIAVDNQITVTLSSSTNDQTVYVGWNKNSSDDVIIGTGNEFSSASGDSDQKIPLYDFDTDASGVTNVTDRRQIGRLIDVDSIELGKLFGMEPSTEPDAPSGDDVNIWNSGNEVKAKFSDGSTVTIAQE